MNLNDRLLRSLIFRIYLFLKIIKKPFIFLKIFFLYHDIFEMNKYLKKISNTSNKRDHYEKTFEIIKIIEKAISKNIRRFQHFNLVEIGSGSSTIIFSYVVKRLERKYPELCIKFISFEQSFKWKTNVEKSLKLKNLPSPIKLTKVKNVKNKPSHITEKFPSSIFLLFIDGPIGTYRDSKHRPIYSDLNNAMKESDLFMAVVDGRQYTIDWTLNKKNNIDYNITFETIFALSKNRFKDAMKFKYHTLFEKNK